MLNKNSSDQMSAAAPIKNRLFLIFRASALIRLLTFILLQVLPRQTHSLSDWLLLGHVVEVMLFFVYLSIPLLQKRLGRYFLPIAIGWATIVPLLVQNMTLYSEFERLDATLSLSEYAIPGNTLIFGAVNQTIVVLIVPLIVVASTYSSAILTLYCFLIFLFDIIVSLSLITINLTAFLLSFALIIFRTLLYGVVGFMINQVVSMQMEQQHRLMDANKQLREYAVVREQLATSRERNRIARELHDTLAHTLSAATVQLEAVSIIWDQQPQKAQQMVIKSASMMRDGLGETRRALQALRAGSLDNENLINAVSILAASLMTRYPIVIEVHEKTPMASYSSTVEHGLYRIVQEAMFNATKHAQATHITIDIDPSPRQLVITVTDDGVGFNLDNAISTGHFGLRGMQERSQHIHAELQIASQLGKGTKVIVTLLEDEDNDAHSNLR